MLDSEDLLAELEYEVVSTEKLLKLVPADKLEWQPHPKAMTLGALALHVATISGGYTTFAATGSTDLNTLVSHPQPKDKEEILSGFSKGVSNAKDILKGAFDGWAGKSWDLTRRAEAIFTIPRALMVRLLVFNHWYHHRGQLSTYLRTLGIKLPSVYGPSADEDPFA
jgi:uncharacterized damage-inducible protein DinB